MKRIGVMTTTPGIKLSFIEEQLIDRLADLLEREIPEAVRIVLYGSRARGDSSEESDLDVAVILDRPKVDLAILEKVWRLKWRALESLQAEEFPLSLHVLTLNDLQSVDFGVERVIKREGKTVWERKH